MVSWKGTFGFITLGVSGEVYRNTENIFLHISDLVYVYLLCLESTIILILYSAIQ